MEIRRDEITMRERRARRFGDLSPTRRATRGTRGTPVSTRGRSCVRGVSNRSTRGIRGTRGVPVSTRRRRRERVSTRESTRGLEVRSPRSLRYQGIRGRNTEDVQIPLVTELSVGKPLYNLPFK